MVLYSVKADAMFGWFLCTQCGWQPSQPFTVTSIMIMHVQHEHRMMKRFMYWFLQALLVKLPGEGGVLLCSRGN